MSLVKHAQLAILARPAGGPHVSIYLPVETAGRETRQNAVRLKNLRTAAEEQLIATGMRPTLARDFLAAIEALETDDVFWDDRESGLAILATEDVMETFWLPESVEETVVVGERFHVKPLASLLSEDGFFYVLAISMNDIRFLRCTRFGQRELKVPDMPRNMAAALWPDDPERQAQFHSQPRGEASGGVAIFHGTGADAEADALTKDRLLRYFQAVDKAVQGLLKDSREPLVLASVDYLQPIYAQANSYQGLLPSGVEGNPDRLRPEGLREAAWRVVEPVQTEERRALLERYGTQAAAGRGSADLPQVLRAAHEGRVETLLFALDASVWGRFEAGEMTLRTQQEPGDEDLIDVAIVETLSNGGDIRCVAQKELPEGAPAAAILRY